MVEPNSMGLTPSQLERIREKDGGLPQLVHTHRSNWREREQLTRCYTLPLVKKAIAHLEEKGEDKVKIDCLATALHPPCSPKK